MMPELKRMSEDKSIWRNRISARPFWILNPGKNLDGQIHRPRLSKKTTPFFTAPRTPINHVDHMYNVNISELLWFRICTNRLTQWRKRLIMVGKRLHVSMRAVESISTQKPSWKQHRAWQRTIMKTCGTSIYCDGDNDLLAGHKKPNPSSWWKTVQAAHSLWC